jgi:hypothetical protein
MLNSLIAILISTKTEIKRNLQQGFFDSKYKEQANILEIKKIGISHETR